MAIRSAEGNDEERLTVLDRCAPGDEGKEGVVLAHRPSTRRHQGLGGAATSPARGSTTVPNERKRSYRSERRSATGTRTRRSSWATSAVLIAAEVASWSVCAPPAGSLIRASTTPVSSRSGPASFIA